MIRVHFTDYFNVSPSALENYGAFNVSLINDLPLFVDPFLLFNSKKPEYRKLHDDIIDYLRFLRDRSLEGRMHPGLIEAWFKFPEVKQNWLGYSLVGNEGRGLGSGFARSLNTNLATIFSTFGDEEIARASHLEKLCLIEEGVGRDSISDFTTNLIKRFLLEYTETFAKRHIDASLRRVFAVPRVSFNYDTGSWTTESFDLPVSGEDFVLLTPRDILTKEEGWICRADIVNDFRAVVGSIPNDQLRGQLNGHFLRSLPKKPKASDEAAAVWSVVQSFPQLIEWYIKYKEDHGDRAVSRSDLRVTESEALFIQQVARVADLLFRETAFYQTGKDTREEAELRARFLKDVIEKKGGHRLFYVNGEPIRRETDLHILFRLTWFGTPSDISREVNDGRGPADFKASRGAWDKSIIEFKLASNTQLRSNLEKQTKIYQDASDAKGALKVIVYFSASEFIRVQGILHALKLSDHPDILLIDARSDNKPSGSKA